ncbi:MAG: preprotein translocase subunit SecG [Muribaculaceae bacterium]|nr:preprotein translocase subunit SecG [Muribaculaceae bacterium]
MYTLLAILIALASLLLIGAVLIQKSKGGGLAQNVGGYNQYMGVRKTTEFIEKVTWGLAIFICVLSIATAFLGSSTTATADQPQIKELKVNDTQAPAFETPAAPAADAQQAAPAAPAAPAPEAK